MKTDAVMISINKIRNLVTVVAVVFVATSCSNESQRKLDRMIEEQNASCPIEISGEIAVEKVMRSGDTVVYDVKVDDRLSVRQLSENAAVARGLVADAIAGSDSPEVRAELETCRDAGAMMKYMLTDERGDTFSIIIYPVDYLK